MCLAAVFCSCSPPHPRPQESGVWGGRVKAWRFGKSAATLSWNWAAWDKPLQDSQKIQVRVSAILLQHNPQMFKVWLHIPR